MSAALIVGISGVTNGGKSVLSKNLLKILPIGTKLIQQDDYFYSEDSPHHIPCPGGLNHHNWDVITATDMDRMVHDIGGILSKMNDSGEPAVASQATAAVKQIEFHSEDFDLMDNIDHNFFNRIVNSLMQECAASKRNILLIDGFTIFDDSRLREMCELKFFLTLDKETCYNRRRTRTYNPPDPPNYFDLCVWPMYEAHLNRIKDSQNINFYDGKCKMSDLFIEALKKIISTSKY